jgi:hypothetical protein
MKYLLFVFAKHEDQESFVKILAEEIVGVIDTTDIKFYFGDESAILTFNTKESNDNVKDFFLDTLGASGIVYFLSPYEPDKMSYWLDRKVEKHLFDTDKRSDIVENTLEEQVEVQKLIFGDLEKGLDSLIKDIEDDIDEINDIKQLKSKPKVKTVDELLDKIIDSGYESLTEKELILLNEYSKK